MKNILYCIYEELEKLKRQEKEANDAADSLRKEATHDIQNAHTSSTNLCNTVSTPLSTADIYASPSEGIFTDSSYDDEVVQTRSKVNKNFEAHALSAFMYGIIDEEVYVTQPPNFVDLKFPNKDKKDIILVKVYVDDNIFGSTKKSWCDEFEDLMKNSVKTASTPIETQKPLIKDEEAADVDSVLVLDFRFQVTPKTSHLQAVKRIFRYLKGQPKLGLWYPKVSSFDLDAYSDSDYAGVNLDRKSITGGCQFLCRRLMSWKCIKQTIMATSTIEAEYVAAVHYYGQVLWIQNQLLDYGFNIMNTKIYIDNESIIYIVKNLVFHSKTKHIKIRHHFIRDAYEKNLIHVLKIHTDDNVVDLLTKAFDVSRFNFLVVNIGLLNL
uniref:Uncharacterized protein n=1 Tax=Tanacetum cinerariifolium TaxID=118510 RepID=A0A6L2NZA1_TANCI|nr:hypothetical protein [Tanacetum cinerariifolium]